MTTVGTDGGRVRTRQSGKPCGTNPTASGSTAVAATSGRTVSTGCRPLAAKAAGPTIAAGPAITPGISIRAGPDPIRARAATAAGAAATSSTAVAGRAYRAGVA